MATVLALMLAAWLSVVALVVAGCRHELRRLWREPVFGTPILVLESDDWGAGPLAQKDALREIADVLDRHRDGQGRPAVASLALVLAVPDGRSIGALGRYARIDLGQAPFAPVLGALLDGQARGVFALQLHGMEHYWPDTLMASPDPSVRDWLSQPGPAVTEKLPPHMQSRWVDVARLPSRPHEASVVEVAVAEEVRAYTRIVGTPPTVVVPPTFVWTRDVERAWAAHGVECVVTPGRRSTCRDADGRPACDEGPIANGDRADDLTFIVRTDYFEPLRGRDAVHALSALARAASQGRPCVLENHRDNFVGDPQERQASLAELDTLYREALRQHPGLRFVSTRELSVILRERRSQWLITDACRRFPSVWVRIAAAGRPWRLLRLTGAAAVVGGLLWVFAAAQRAGVGQASH